MKKIILPQYMLVPLDTWARNVKKDTDATQRAAMEALAMEIRRGLTLDIDGTCFNLPEDRAIEFNWSGMTVGMVIAGLNELKPEVYEKPFVNALIHYIAEANLATTRGGELLGPANMDGRGAPD